MKNQIEKRSFALKSLQVRSKSAEGEPFKRTVGGYVTKFNTMSENLGWFREVRETIAPGAFKQSIKEDDIRAFWNHNSDIILGRSTNDTLTLREDDVGLQFDLDLPDTQAGRDAFTSIERGDVTGMSFGFFVREEKTDYGEKENDPITRTLLDIQLFEVSPVIFPAYPDSEAEARDERSFRHWAKKTLDAQANKVILERRSRLDAAVRSAKLQAVII